MQRVEGSASGSLQIALTDDGSACIVSDMLARTTKAFDRRTGDELVSVPPAGERQERDQSGPRMLGFSGNGVVTIMSRKGVPREVGQLSVSAQGMWAVGSVDGGFAAGWKEREVPSSWIGAMLGTTPTKAPNVLVWDFERLLDAETEEANGAKLKSALP